MANSANKGIMWGNIIQIAMFVVIALASIFTGINVYEQKDYFRTTTRPWISIVPKREIKISNDTLFYNFDLVNRGTTPAFDIEVYSICRTDREFPKEIIKLTKNAISKKSLTIIFQEEKAIVETDGTLINKKTEKPAKASEIFQDIKNDKMYMHLYIEYKDLKDKPYFFGITYLLRNLEETETGYICDWYYTDAFVERINHSKKK